MAVPEDKLMLYDNLINAFPEIERKGKNMPYTSTNGHMFSQMSKQGVLGIRLPAEDRQLFLDKFNTSLFENYGTIMKEYVSVPDKLLSDIESLKVYVKKSYDYVKSLKPK